MNDMNKTQNRYLLSNHPRQKRVSLCKLHTFLLFVITLLITFFLIGNSIITFANAKSNQELYKYYTSVQLQKGDYLWSLANKYAANDTVSREEFIHEVCRINGISENNILHSGDYLIISCYASEQPQQNISSAQAIYQ